MIPIIAISATCYLAIGVWMLVDMEAGDRLGYRWTDIAVVLAAPLCGLAWLLWEIPAICIRAVVRWCR